MTPSENNDANRTTALVFVALRLLSRTVFSKFRFGLDDAFTLVALANLIAVGIITSYAIDGGLGKHVTAITAEQLPTAVYRMAVLNCVGQWLYALPKLAIVALLKRLFIIEHYVVITFYVLCSILFTTTLAGSILSFELCQPIAHAWDPIRVPGTCLPMSHLLNLTYWNSAYSAFLDLLFAIYPQFVIGRLNMSLKKRLAVGTALGLSGIGTFAGVDKMMLFRDLDSAHDNLWVYVPIHILGVVETDVLIISAALPTMGPFFRFVRERVRKLNWKVDQASAAPSWPLEENRFLKFGSRFDWKWSAGGAGNSVCSYQQQGMPKRDLEHGGRGTFWRSSDAMSLEHEQWPGNHEEPPIGTAR